MTPGGRASEGANLVTTEWRGREKLHHLNAEPIRAVAERWINQYDRAPAQMPETSRPREYEWMNWHDASDQP